MARKPALVQASRYSFNAALGHISIHTPSLFRIERGLVGEQEPRTSKIAIFL